MRRNAFTVVELVITMAIMTILMALAIVILTNSQANGRDAKRKSDVATIARGLEQRYDNGMPQPSDGTKIRGLVGGSTWADISALTSLQAGGYPSTKEIEYILGNSAYGFDPNPLTNESFITEDLPGSAPESFVPPDGGAFVALGSATTPDASTVGKNYVYAPRQPDGSVCNHINDICTSYALFYVTEVDGILHTVESKHQQ